MLKHCTFHVISGLERDFPNFIFWPILTLQKVPEDKFSSSLRKSDLKTCIAALNPETFWFDLLYVLGDLRWPWPVYYGHKAQEMIHVSNAAHGDSLALFALNIKIVLASVTKTDLTLTWPVMSSVTSRSNFTPCLESSRSGLSNGVLILEIGLVVWEITGGRYAPPPQNVWLAKSSTGRGFGYPYSVKFGLWYM